MKQVVEMRKHACPASGRPGRSDPIAAGALLAVVLAGASLSAKDCPQWRGAERLGVWTETGVLREFPDEGLTVKWRAPVGAGYDAREFLDELCRV